MPVPAPTETRRAALRASYICAALAAALLASHYLAAILPEWTRGLSLFSGGLALAGVGLAAFSLHPDGWTDIRQWPAQTAFGFNAFLAIAFFVAAIPSGGSVRP
jgi:hypothetical protein